MKIKKFFPFAASAFFCSLPLSANVLYWVDATSYFNADASGKIDGTSIWNIARDFSSTEKSEYSDNYNWATGYTVKEVSAQDSVSGQTTVYYVPVYEYASTAAAPDENTDVYFKCDDFSMGSDSAGYRYRIAGSTTLSADTTVKSITIERTDDNWMMFGTNGHDLTILEDVVYNSYAVALIGSSSSTNIKVGGSVRVLGSGGLSRYNAFRLGGNGVGSIKIGGDIIFEKQTRMQLTTAGNASVFDNPQSVVSGIADFSGYARAPRSRSTFWRDRAILFFRGA